MVEKRIAVSLIGIAALYTIAPMALNGSGLVGWIALPPALTFAIYQAALVASAFLANASRREGKGGLFVASLVAAMLLAVWTYLTLSYCPGGTSSADLG